ncbi:MAG: sugar kinase [Spirochaetaceae bacterium]
MKLRDNYRYALLVPTSMGVRLTPDDAHPMHVNEPLRLQVTSAESNVASIPSFLGLPVKVLTALVAGSPIARLIRDDLAARHMDVEAKVVEQGGPWGYRHQFNLADRGFGGRGPRVFNDRAGEVGRTLGAEDFDLERIFGKEGVAVVHISGLIAALSPETGRFCLEVARAAKRYGTRISFDLNYRASFWKDREKDLGEIFQEIAGISDILVGNEEDFQLCLGFAGPEAGGKDIAAKIDTFKDMIERVRKSYPNATAFATTLREVVDANRHRWGAIMFEGGNWHVIEPREIGVIDRIGGGDGFVGGLLHAALRGWEPEKWVQFGWASGALAVTFMTDYAQPADEEQIWSIWEGNARVKR